MSLLPSRLIAVVFDMDGVLVDSTEAHVLAWTRFLEERSIPAPTAGVRSLFGRRAADALAQLLDLDADAPQVRTALDDLEGYADALLDEHGPGQQLVPGVAEMVADLRDSGWRLGVATSARRHIAEHALGALRTTFETLVAAEDVTRGKPDPEPYLTAATRLGVAPGTCLVVEDAVVGVTAGKRAGMQVVAVPTTADAPALRSAGADAVLDRITDLPELLAPHRTGTDRDRGRDWHTTGGPHG